MRIAIVSPQSRFFAAGDSRRVLMSLHAEPDRSGGCYGEYLAEQLAQRGHEVAVFTYRRAECLPDGTVTIRSWRKRRGRSPSARLGLERWLGRQLAKGGFDVSLSVSSTMPATVLLPYGGLWREDLLRRATSGRGRWQALARRGMSAVDFKSLWAMWREARTLRNRGVGRFVAVSGYIQRQLTGHYRIDSQRIDRLTPPVPVVQVQAKLRQQWRQQMRRGFGVDENQVLYAHAGRDWPRQGLGRLLEAMAILRQRGVDAVLAVVGPMSYACQCLSERLGIRQWVRQAGATGRMAELYCAADAAVQPSFFDAAGSRVLQSLVVGTPVVTSVHDGGGDYVKGPDGRMRGRLVEDAADPGSLAEAMVDLADADQRRRCAAAAAGIADELDVAGHVGRIEQILAQAAADR